MLHFLLYKGGAVKEIADIFGVSLNAVAAIDCSLRSGTPEEDDDFAIIVKACELADLTYHLDEDDDNRLFVCENDSDLERFMTIHKQLSNCNELVKKYVASKWGDVLDEIATLETIDTGFHAIFLSLEDGGVSSGFYINEPNPELPEIEVFRLTSDDCNNFDGIWEHYDDNWSDEEIADDLKNIGAISKEEYKQFVDNVAEYEENPFYHIDRVKVAHAIWNESGMLSDYYEAPSDIISEFDGVKLSEFLEALEAHWEVIA